MASENKPPPTEHVLRPHNVHICAIFSLLKEFEGKDVPAKFKTHLFGIMLQEMSEVAQPRPYSQFFEQIRKGPFDGLAHDFLHAINSVHNDLSNTIVMSNFFSCLCLLFREKEEESDPEPLFARRSMFGYYARRCYLTFMKMSASAVGQLVVDYRNWRTKDDMSSYEPVAKIQLNHVLFKTQADRTAWAQPQAFAAFEKAHATGDDNVATEHLRRFFEQHFHEHRDSGIRQHALINLVRMHFMRSEFAAARKLLTEAIISARSAGDKLTLQHCISLQNRLPPLLESQKPDLNHIQPMLHPLDILYDVKKLLQVENEQPLSASFERMVQAMGMFDHWASVQSLAPARAEQWGRHAVQSVLWSEAGCDQLSSIEENIVLAFTGIGGDDNNRLTVSLNRAYKTARQGDYGDSLSQLLETQVWRGITVPDYDIWAVQVWHVLVLRASRRGQKRMFEEFLSPRRPTADFNPKDYFLDGASTIKSLIRDELHEVIKLRGADQATTAVEQLLKALWHSEFQSRWSLYRTGIILLADVGLEFGMTKRSRRILDEIMPQIINGGDLEQRALATFTLARCIMVGDGKEEVAASTLKEAIHYLHIARDDYQKLEMYRSLMEVYYLLAVVYHNLGQENERDEASTQHLKTEKRACAFEEMVVDTEVQVVWDIVCKVGVALSKR